jgi:hypothetical protein
MLKIRLCQWWLVGRQSMLACPAATGQNDGDKCRKNGPGKVTSLSVGQGEPPGELINSYSQGAQVLFEGCCCWEVTTAPQDLGIDNGDKSNLNFLVIRHSSFVILFIRVMAREFPYAHPPACPSMSLASQQLHSAALCFFSAQSKSV